MIEEKQQIFSNFMDEFVKLDINQKNEEIIAKQRKILALLFKYATEHYIEYEFLKSREINDINDGNGTNEDFLEAMMVYTQNIEEIIGSILQKQSK